MIHIVIGPPAAGKTTWVRERAQPGDVTIDYDALARVLAVPDRTGHEHPPHVQAVAKAARNAAIDAATRVTGCDVYIIHSTPSPARLDEYRRLGANIVTVDPGKATVMRRVAQERPRQMLAAAHQWYEDEPARRAQLELPPAPAQQEQPRMARRTRPASKALAKRGTTARGLGWQHQQQRDYLLRKHVDGTLCWWCDQPMYRDQELAADHTQPRARGGKRADRLLHAGCNAERRDGSRDHLRPAVTGQNQPNARVEGRAAWVSSPW